MRAVDPRLTPALPLRMRRFYFSVENYRQHVIPDEWRITRHAKTMPPLIKRYGLAGRSVLALGPSYGDQELWFAFAGCPLVMIDSHPGMIPYLDIPEAQPHRGEIEYAVADAFSPDEWLDGRRFDVLFCSGFSPDVFHHAEVLSRGPWPADAAPFTAGTMQLAKAALSERGILIALFYSHGPAPADCPHYVDALRAQLRDNGMTLLEMHDVPTYPGIHMIVAQRGAAQVAINESQTITHIHGRATVQNEARLIFSPAASATVP